MKGVADLMIMAIVGTVVSTPIMAVTVQSGLQYGDLFQSETVKTTGERIESGVHAIAALEEARLEMRLEGSKGYKIYEEEGGKFLSYGSSSNNTREMEDISKIDYSIKRDLEDEKVHYICIIKNTESISIEGGKCGTGHP